MWSQSDESKRVTVLWQFVVLTKSRDRYLYLSCTDSTYLSGQGGCFVFIVVCIKMGTCYLRSYNTTEESSHSRQITLFFMKEKWFYHLTTFPTFRPESLAFVKVYRLRSVYRLLFFSIVRDDVHYDL